MLEMDETSMRRGGAGEASSWYMEIFSDDEPELHERMYPLLGAWMISDIVARGVTAWER